MWWGTYPSRSTACWWARLKNLGRLISNLWICHDRWRAEWVGVWICGIVLLKHTHKHTLFSNYTSYTSTVCESSRTKKGREQNTITQVNSQSFCASPPSCFSCWPSCCRTRWEGSSSCPEQTQKEKTSCGWAQRPHVQEALSACKQLHHMYKHTCTDYSVLNVSCTCVIWDTVAFTFHHFITCDLVTLIRKLETKYSMQIYLCPNLGFILDGEFNR